MSQNHLALVDQQQLSYEYVPTVAMSPQQVVQLVRKLEDMKKNALRNNVDYMLIPGTPQPSLLKPGAERLLQCFGLGHRMTCVKEHEDWETGFFYYQYKATIFKTYPTHEVIVAECEGSANSKESRYRDRWVTEKKARDLGIDISNCQWREKSGQYGNYREYKIENPDPYSIVNTLQKMAQKRALVGATLQATGSSGLFTQDLEDMNLEGQSVHPSTNQNQGYSNQSSRNQQQAPKDPNAPASKQQTTAIYSISSNKGLNKDEVKALASQAYGREITSMTELNKGEASELINFLQAKTPDELKGLVGGAK